MVDVNSYGLGAVLGLGLIGEDRYAGDFFSLPEEVREEIERRRDEIRSPEDLRRIAKEARLRR